MEREGRESDGVRLVDFVVRGAIIGFFLSEMQGNGPCLVMDEGLINRKEFARRSFNMRAHTDRVI